MKMHAALALGLALGATPGRDAFCRTAADAAPATTLRSPDGRLAVSFRLDDGGVPIYSLSFGGRPVLRDGRSGSS